MHSVSAGRLALLALGCTVWVAAAAPPPERLPDPAALAKDIQQAYAAAGDMSGSFVQIYTDKLRQKQRRESGRLWVKGDGRVRWTYDKPELKEFIYNGSTAFFYEPASAQVTLFEDFAQTPLAHAMQFLWGAGDLLKTFDLALAAPDSADCPALQPGELALRLRPRQPLATVDHVYLVVMRRGLRVSQSRVVDRLGNSTDYCFSNMRLGSPISPEQFAFVVPEGVDILRASRPAAAPLPADLKRPIQTPVRLD